MRKYETVVLFKSDATKEYINSVSKKLEKIMKAKPGQLIKKDDWGIRKFAYPIQDLEQGRYIFWYFENEPKVVKEIDKALRFDEELLRYATIISGPEVSTEEEDPRGKKPVKGRGRLSVQMDYKDTAGLTKFLTERGKIIPRRVTGIDSKSQRDLTIAVKRARQLALLSFTEGFYQPHTTQRTTDASASSTEE